jgi:transposase-like protein
LLNDAGFLREIVERVLQEMLETEMTEHVGAAPYQRTAERKGHRNGYKPRTLTAGFSEHDPSRMMHVCGLDEEVV